MSLVRSDVELLKLSSNEGSPVGFGYEPNPHLPSIPRSSLLPKLVTTPPRLKERSGCRWGLYRARAKRRRVPIGGGESRHNDLAVALEGEGPGPVPATEVREHPAPVAKREVQTAVRFIPCQREKRVAEVTGHDDLAVGLAGRGKGHVDPAEVSEHPAPGAEGCIKSARAGADRVREAQSQKQSRHESQEGMAPIGAKPGFPISTRFTSCSCGEALFHAGSLFSFLSCSGRGSLYTENI